MRTVLDWLAAATVKTHVGVLCLMLAVTYALVSFTPVPTSLYLVLPPAYFVYLGLSFVLSGSRRKHGEPP